MSSSPDPFQSYFDSHEPKQELDSPFLNEEYLVEEARTALWRTPVPKLQLESPFLEAFEEEWVAIGEPEVEESDEFFDKLDEEEFEEQVPEATKPVISLEKIKIEGFTEITLTLGNSGQYEGFFKVPPLSSNKEIKISGQVQIEQGGSRRGYDYRRDRKQWDLRKAWANVEPKGAIGSSTAVETPVQRNGKFTTSTIIGFNGLVRRLAIQVIVESKKGKRFGANAIMELIDLEGFLAIIDPKEKSRPTSQTHLEFLASVRKIYQGGLKDPLKSIFDWVLYRYRNVKPLFAPDTAQDNRLKLYAVLYANGEWLDIGHVLTGIEGSPKQEPDKDQSLPKLARPELIVTWAGDLGSALQHYIKDFWNALEQSDPIDLNDYLLKYASRVDLIGDIDGINIGSAYDASRSLAENLNAYYGKKSRRRYHEFIANSKNEEGMAELPLVTGQKTPKLSKQAQQAISFHTQQFLLPLKITDKLYGGTDLSKRKLVDSIVEIDSLEMEIVADYFVRFLEDGLALERKQGVMNELEFEEYDQFLSEFEDAEFEDGSAWNEVANFPEDDAESQHYEMLLELEDDERSYGGEEDSAYSESEAFSDDSLEEMFVLEGRWVTHEKEASSPFEEAAYQEESSFDEEFLIQPKQLLSLLNPGAIIQQVKQLLDEGAFSLSLLGRFASGQIWNEDHLALELLFHRQPQLRPDQWDKLSDSKRLKLAVKYQRELMPIREKIVRPLFGNPVNFKVEPLVECQVQDLRLDVKKLGPLRGGEINGKDWYKRDAKQSPRQTTIDSIMLHHMAYNIGNDVNLYKKVGAHYIVTADGQVAQLYDNLDFLNASNGFNSRSVAIEFAGNFPNHRYHWWKDRKQTIPDRCYLTPAQIRAGRCLLARLKTQLPGIKYLYAHRQSSKIREDDPGPDVWFHIGEWALSNLNLTDRLPSTHVGNGQPIPEIWRRSRSASSQMTISPSPKLPQSMSGGTSSRLPQLGMGVIPPTNLDEYRKFRLTTYYIVDQRELPTSPVHIPIYDKTGSKIAEGSPQFFAKLSLNGTAHLIDGRLINVTGKTIPVSHDEYAEVLTYHRQAYAKRDKKLRDEGKQPTSTRYSGIVVENDRVVEASTFHEISASQRGIGYGLLRGIPLVPFRTLAADIGEVKYKNVEPKWKGKGGLVPPGTHIYIKEFVGLPLPDGTIHDGWFIVNDTGGGIFGAHFDVFVGTDSLLKQVKQAKIPTFGQVWFAGIEKRIPPGYTHGLQL